ncbi:hypothetical protein HDU93_000448 [Gonapodya sp. JEL0774]|nr:hypothetical protein HDU93_000448 [Gonapodya sp. JEL0774]
MSQFYNTEGYCESLGLPDGTPEYFSAATAPIISIIGAYGVAGGGHYVPTVRLMYSFVFANGIGSFLAHFTRVGVWWMIDRLTLILPVVMVDFLMLDEVIGLEARRKRIPLWAYQTISSLSALTVGTLVTAQIAQQSAGIGTGSADTVFGVGVAVLFTLVLITTLQKRSSVTPALKRLPIVAFIVAIIAFTLWTLNEKLCLKIPLEARRWIPGHAIWHIVAASATYLAGQYLAFMYVQRHGYTPVMTKSLRVICAPFDEKLTSDKLLDLSDTKNSYTPLGTTDVEKTDAGGAV